MMPATVSRFCTRLALMVAVVSLSASSFGAMPRDSKFDKDHADLKAPNLEKEVSALTEQVASKLPHSGGSTNVAIRNLIDQHLFGAMRVAKIPHAPLTTDHEFCRRAYLDLTGRIPTVAQLESFITSDDPAKRDKLINQLLGSPAWVDHWAYWFEDLFRNCANRIGEPTTKHFDAWVRKSLADGKPYDQFVRELLTASAPSSVWSPDSAPSAFLARWHVAGDTMYSDRLEDTSDEIIVQSARIFLGVNYQCISCHGGKGFLEKVNVDLVPKTRRDFWAMGAFFGKTRVRIVPFQDRFTITDDGEGYDTKGASSVRLRRNGGEVHPTFLLTGEKADLSKPLRPQFARMLTEHPQFARATVNLIWKQFFGVGIVEPVDNFDLARQDPANPPEAPWPIQPTNPELLNALAAQFAKDGYDLRKLMRLITESSAYQLSSRFDGEWKESYTPYFSRHYVRLLSAEQVHDAISEATLVHGNYKRRDPIYGTELKPIRYWTEASTPEQINHGEAKALMHTFGMANREQFDRQPGGSILQAMTLMNSPFVSSRVKADGESRVAQLVRSDKTDDQIVEQLYLATLSRPPLPQEKQQALEWLSENRRTGAEDLHWALLNKLDFVFNY
ncbi:MAG TPA: DUF1553 domain-containing protein [Methylomirabilota bacterium]|nr:DUF1553 domain-containing protein [Methylomirabilota bacterium]